MSAALGLWRWPPVWRLLRRQEGGDVIPPPDSPEWEGFARHLDELVVRTTRFATLGFGAANLLMWPTDWLVSRGDRHVLAMFAVWRGGMTALLLSLYLCMALWPWARRHPGWFTLPFTTSGTGLCAAVIGEIAGTESPWFYHLYFLLMLPAVVPGQMRQRMAHSLGIGLAIVVGFFGLHPEHRAERQAADALIFLGIVFVLGNMADQFAWMQTVVAYFQRMRIARHAEELQELNATLDARVLEKTEELRALTEHLHVVREEERTHLARELHDDLGQKLSAARYALADARRARARGDEGAAESLESSERMLAAAADTTRHIVGTLRPLVLEQLGLVAACEWLASDMSQRAGVKGHFEATGGDEGLDERLGLAFYRVLQEALTNVLRHASASRVEVSMDVSDEELRLTVTDDGRGLPAELPRRRDGGGLGLVSMRERAQAHGGSLRLESPEQGGTRVRLRLPRGRGRQSAGGEA